MTFFKEIEKRYKMHMESPDFKLCHRTTVTKTTWYYNKNRYTVQWNKMEDPDINPHSYRHLIFNKGAKTHIWEKR
jgi:hypothetical protein